MNGVRSEGKAEVWDTMDGCSRSPMGLLPWEPGSSDIVAIRNGAHSVWKVYSQYSLFTTYCVACSSSWVESALVSVMYHEFSQYSRVGTVLWVIFSQDLS